MKKINVIYNHNIFEAPYNQREVRKTESELKEKFGRDIQIFVTHTCFLAPNQFFYDSDFIMVEHSFEIDSKDKKELAGIINRSVTKLKAYEPIDVVVSFRKINEDDLFLFEGGKKLT